MDGRYEHGLWLRAQAAEYIRAVFAKARDQCETEFSERAVEFYYRPEDGKSRSLTIVSYWDQGFYVWAVWKREGGEREDVHARIGDEASRRKEFPECGYEVEWNNFGVISDDELKEAAPEKSAAIEIQEFVNDSQIPALYFEKPYYLEPDKGAGKAYALLREALAKSGKVGVAQFVLRNRESLCVMKAQGNALTLNTLRFASEIRPMDELRLPSTKSWRQTR